MHSNRRSSVNKAMSIVMFCSIKGKINFISLKKHYNQPCYQYQVGRSKLNDHYLHSGLNRNWYSDFSSVVNGHCNHLALKFSVCVKERQDRLPTMYWLPKRHKTPYKARFIANSSSCTTTELSKLLTSCLTAVKNHVIRYCEKVYERSGKNLFWSIKTSGEVLNKLKSRGFRATNLSTYDFSTLYTTLPHN